MTDATGERLARLEEQVTALRAQADAIARQSAVLAVAEARGYVDGQMRSVLHNVESNAADLREQIRAVSEIVHGERGDNGLRSHVFRLRWLIGIQWIILAVIGSAALGLRIPGIP